MLVFIGNGFDFPEFIHIKSDIVNAYLDNRMDNRDMM